MIEVVKTDWIETTWKGVERYPLLTSDTVYEVHGTMTMEEERLYKIAVYINVIPGKSPHIHKAVITKGDMIRADSEKLAIEKLKVTMGVGVEWYARYRGETLV